MNKYISFFFFFLPCKSWVLAFKWMLFGQGETSLNIAADQAHPNASHDRTKNHAVLQKSNKEQLEEHENSPRFWPALILDTHLIEHPQNTMSQLHGSPPLQPTVSLRQHLSSGDS